MGLGDIIRKVNPLNIIKEVAPTIGSAIGGPLGGMATKFISEKLLGKPDASPDEIEEAILNASPEQLLKLKELDKQFAVEMKKLDIDVFRLEVEDRSSAREMFKVNIWPQIVLSAIFVVGYFVIFWIILRRDIVNFADDPFLQGMFGTILGVLTASIPQILGFWFGSSFGSKEKTQKMGNMQNMPG
ncbi:MAG: hypothetical protein KDH97_05225 [Calditrichaeota bacterium]|nr:hypothetical protein [Calditrichota bacterium]MCB0303541.1 hypothetical protein [Calditrichota bacterium]MCB9088688.1 hypothetical protein [Calditrichia bacterium]